MLASGSFIPTLECDEMTLNMLESSTNFGFGALRFRIYILLGTPLVHVHAGAAADVGCRRRGALTAGHLGEIPHSLCATQRDDFELEARLWLREDR